MRAMQARLDRLDQDEKQHIAALEDVRKQRKLLRSLMQEAADSTEARPATTPSSVTQPLVLTEPPPPAEADKPTRTKGMAEAIMGLVRRSPGITRDEIVEALTPKFPGLESPRRVILNNLGNMARNDKIVIKENRCFEYGADTSGILTA